jgi:hypothetical protein
MHAGPDEMGDTMNLLSWIIVVAIVVVAVVGLLLLENVWSTSSCRLHRPRWRQESAEERERARGSRT